MRLLVLVRAAISSTRAPLKPLSANSAVATSMMLRLRPLRVVDALAARPGAVKGFVFHCELE